MMTEEQLIDRICLTCVDVRHAATDESAQKFITDIRGLAEQLAALTQPASPALKLPDGWVAVPLEPTEEMIAAGDRFMDGLSRLGDAYDAMLESAPDDPHTAPIEPICATGGAEAVQLPDLNDDLIDILGRPNFTCSSIAQILRMGGRDIPRKSENEQAAAIHFLLNHYLADNEKWLQAAGADLKAMGVCDE